MAEVTVQDGGEVARPLKILIPLIEKDFELAEKAGIEYFKAAGEKLTEAREGHFEGDTAGFYSWAQKSFRKSKETIRTYMQLAGATPGKSFTSMRDFARKERQEKSEIHRMRPGSHIRRNWTASVDEIAMRTREEQRREFLKERDAEIKLGLRLISIGYKVLAQELHPDRGGSREAMSRLNRVRDRLKSNV